MTVDLGRSGAHWRRDFDWVMAGVTFAIALLGLQQIYSATLNTNFHGAYQQHLVWLLLGIGVFWTLSHIDYRFLVALSPAFWVVGMALLVAVLLFTDPVNGSRRWLPTPFGVSIQVSEFMKVVLLLVLAKSCKGFAIRTLQPADFLPAALAFFAVLTLVVLQPDLSTALSMLPMFAMAMYVSTIPKRYFVIAILVVVLLVPLAWSSLKPYQKARIAGFMSPDEAPLGIGYQILQSKIAVGAGGMWGQGFVQGSQTQLRFLPTPHTDFILAAFAEERGFVGIALVLGLYYVLLLRILDTAQSARDLEGTLLAMGVAGVLLFHILVNGGMVANKLPVTGLPLPLMSYGGSNLLTVLAMLGIVNSVRIRRFVN